MSVVATDAHLRYTRVVTQFLGSKGIGVTLLGEKGLYEARSISEGRMSYLSELSSVRSSFDSKFTLEFSAPADEGYMITMRLLNRDFQHVSVELDGKENKRILYPSRN